MTRQTFKTTDVLRLEVANTPSGLVNQIKNPPDTEWLFGGGLIGTSGSGFGWVSDAAWSPFLMVQPVGVAARWMTWDMIGGLPNQFWSEDWAQAAGEYAAARMLVATLNGTTAWYRINFEWLNSLGAVIGSSAVSGTVQGTRVDTLGGNTISLGAQLAPAGTVRARLRVDLYAASGGGNPAGGTIYFKDATVAKASTAAALSGLGVISTTPTWTNVIGPTHSITITRNALNIGILNAEILDATLDPSQSDLVRPGKRVRVMALNNATGTWWPLINGKIIRGETAYDPRRTDVKRARVSITAVDSTSQLSQVNRTIGVNTIAGLWKPLEGAGVPFWPSSTGTITTLNKTASRSLLDQVGIVRDSDPGAQAWVDRWGMLRLVRSIHMNSAPLGTVVTTLNESKYSDLAIDYDTDRCINVVNVKLRRINVATGGEVEVTYGPYIDQASFDKWGPHSADFTVTGITDSEAGASAYAALVLAANATPAVRINSVSIPIRDTTDVTTTKALLDVMDLVTVANTNAGISQSMRITGLEHKITDGKWQLDVNFAINNSVSSPSAVSGVGVATGVTGDPSGWAFLSTSYPTIINHYGGGHRSLTILRVGKQVWVRGLAAVGGFGLAAGNAIVDIPADCRPDAIELFTGSRNGAPIRLDVNPSGALTAPVNALAAGDYLSLAGLSWFVP